MGTFPHPITLTGQAGTGSQALEALVDTGATFTAIPAPILEGLGVARQRRARLRLANGDLVEWDLGEVIAQIDGVRSTILCIFGEAGTPPLIGAHTLEAFLLVVDPIQRRLVPQEGLLMRISPSHKCLTSR